MNFSSLQVVDTRHQSALRPHSTTLPASSSHVIREEEAATSDVDDYQNFMQFYSTVAPHGRLSPMNLPTQPRWTSLSAGGFDGMAYNFLAARGNSKHSSLVGVAVMEGMVVPLADRVPRQPVRIGPHQAELFYGPMMGAWTTAALLAGEAGLTSLDGQWGSHLTLNSNGQARSDLTLYQKLDGAQAATQGHSAAFEQMCLRRGFDTASASLRRIEVHRARGPGAQMMPALSLFRQLQTLCRIDYSSVCDITFGTYIDDTAADLLAREKATLWGRFVKPTWRALWGLDVIPVPELLQPEELQPGDKITEKRWIRKTFLTAFGKLLFFLGFHRARFVQSSLAVTRPLESVERENPKLIVQLGFSTVHSGRLWAALVGNLTGHRGEHHMHREVHETEVVLSDTRLREAYQQVIYAAREGMSPEEQASRLEVLSTLAVAGGQVGAHLKCTNSEGRSQTNEFGSSFVGLGLGLIAPWLPANFSVSMSRRGVHSRHDIAITSAQPNASGRLMIAGTAKIAKRGPDGERATRLSARTWVPLTDEKERRVFSLETHISLGRADPSEVTRLIVEPLQAHFGVLLNTASGAGNLLGAGWRTRREVVYRQNFSTHALRAFASRHAANLTHERSTGFCATTTLAQEFANLFERFPAQEETSSILADALMGAFGRYFEKADLASFGLLMSTLQEIEPENLATLESDCDAYLTASREREALSQKLDHASEEEAKALLHYANTTVRPLLFQVKRLADADPFLSDSSRATLRDALEEEKQSLAQIFQHYEHPTTGVFAAERLARLRQEQTLKPYNLSAGA